MTTFSIALNDPNNIAGGSASNIIRTAQVAANMWARYLQGFGNIEVQISFGRLGSDVLMNGASATSIFIGQQGGIDIFNGGAAAEIQNGADPNGATPDILVTINQDALNQLFYDPSFAQPVPSGNSDAVSVFEHEIGHGLAFNTLRNVDGSIATDSSGPYELVYDQYVSIVGGAAYFSGTNVLDVYGQPVPLYQDLAHIGSNVSGGQDLMMEEPIGRHLAISDLDLAFGQDVGLPIATGRSDFITLNSANDTFTAMAGSDSVSGGLGNDNILGNQGEDFLFGNQGKDTLVGGLDNDAVVGGQDFDFLYGNMGNDVLYGNMGNDTLVAGQGEDTLTAGQGDDVLYGNLGDDVFYGNQGADRFVFGSKEGDDRVIDFSSSQGDLLDLKGQAYSVSQSSNGAILHLSGGGSILLEGVSTSALNSSFIA
ncbi:calcium-binding protein [Bradyrhizobium liaoningense]|uniref:calcium-binding protein n=1 Tax=Bradyrhizobium liaoningense TaxID=43992 RepID=UPI001BA7A079|nr:calcium-binding protein [Bradyrhizobium liaoningense]MBR0904578.1 hypothetical protein [Bradyrhizobium liaoningense]